MLVLKRKAEEEIVITHDENRIVLKVLKIGHHVAKIGIKAPDEMVILRAELEGRDTKEDPQGGGP